jgi:O-antigen biosynthesis protein WbqP
MKRLFDFLLSLSAIVLLAPIFIAISFLIKITSSGPILFWSKRVGKNNDIFLMPKFRSMKVNSPVVPTHLIFDAQRYLTPVGAFLRKFSLDELPQLWSILRGDMSFVGPRPALYNQDDLIALRNKYGVQILLPGLTGWAQINGRDMLTVADKVEYEVEYLRRRSFWFDLKIIYLTITLVFLRSDISH